MTRTAPGTAAAVLGAALVCFGAELRPETVAAWERYLELTEARIERELSEGGDAFLALDFMDPRESSECLRDLRSGKICIARRVTRDEDGKGIPVPSGLVHHWYGAVLVPGATLASVLEWVKTYEDTESFYEGVESSRVISQAEDRYRIFLRLRRKKVLTVVYNTEHEVTYFSHGDGRASSRSISTRIREVERPGENDESELPEGLDRGFLWRLNSYWRFREVEHGTLVECESLSLSRSVPAAARWFVRAFLTSVPRESLEQTLDPIRRHLAPPPGASPSRR